jgi:hypothetical protein
MSFFEQSPPAIPDEPAPRQPDWAAPPENAVGATVPFDLVLAPLPPEGPLRFACAWPDELIEETTAELEAPIREAAARAVELWPDERPVGDEW